jgi:hypothetical protein
MRSNQAWPILFLVAACAHMQSPLETDTPYKYELASPEMDVDAPAPVSDDVIATLSLKDVSADEYAAFQAEAGRLSFHFERHCRRLADAMREHLANVRMYENAIVRYSGPYKFYGVGHSYQQQDGRWMIRIARRFDGLNPRSLDDEMKTLRHEMSHTMGAAEQRVGDEWSARDYAYRCA